MPRDLEAELITAIRRELARLLAITLPLPLGIDRFQAGELRAAIAVAHRGIVPAKFGRLLLRELSPAELKACQRATIKLEQQGRLVRLRLGHDGYRTTHLQLVEPTDT